MTRSILLTPTNVGQLPDPPIGQKRIYVDAASGNLSVMDQDRRIQAAVSGAGIGGWKSALKRNPNALVVMSAPPTIAVSGTNARASGRSCSVHNGTSVSEGNVSLFGGRYYQIAGGTYPIYNYIKALTFTQGSPSAYATFRNLMSFYYTGQGFSIPVYGNGVAFFVKVGGQWATLTAGSTGSGGAVNFINVDFAAPVYRTRIDIVFFGTAYFDGPWVGPTDSIFPAERRGPRGAWFADSFGEGSGNEISAAWGHVPRVLEALQLDDVAQSCVGETGMYAGTSPKSNFLERIARDAAGSDVIFVEQSINDGGYPASQIVARAQAIVDAASAAGITADWVWISPTVNKGPGWITTRRAQNTAMRAWAQARGDVYVDVLESQIAPKRGSHSVTLTAAAANGATALSVSQNLIAGGQYVFADGTGFQAKTGTTIDNLSSAQASGATATLVGGSYLSGAGRVGATSGWGNADLAVSADGTHPTDYGYQIRAEAIVAALLDAVGVR